MSNIRPHARAELLFDTSGGYTVKPAMQARVNITKEGFPLQKICFVLQVREDRLEEYRERHQRVWPEMQDALRSTGWHNYSLFLRDDGLLVGYFETLNLQAALDGMAALEVNSRWQREMRDFFIDPGGRDADRQIAPLEHIFYLP